MNDINDRQIVWVRYILYLSAKIIYEEKIVDACKLYPLEGVVGDHTDRLLLLEMIDLATVVEDVDVLVPQSEAEFGEIQKFGLYPAEECVPFITKQGTPFYYLDNMSLVPKGDVRNYLQYSDFKFRQLEVLYNMARMEPYW